MAILLHFDTSTKACSAAISKDGECLASEFEVFERYAHSEALNPMIMRLMGKANLKFNQLDAVMVGSGPGSYTGLRIGVSAAKGFCFGLSIPLMATSTLELMAHVAKEKAGFDTTNCHWIPMLDARRMEVYSSVFDGQLNRVKNDKAIIVEENFTENMDGEKLVFFGDGMPKCKSILEKDSRAIFLENIYPDAKNLIAIAENKFSRKEFEDLAYFEPEYLKEFGIQ